MAPLEVQPDALLSAPSPEPGQGASSESQGGVALAAEESQALAAVAEGAALTEHPVSSRAAASSRPTFVFFGVVAALSLFADISTKAWAEVALNRRGFEPIELIPGYLDITLAYNRGGAWGLLASANDAVRLPFFLGVSVAAILFIVSLYARLHREQRALTWGLPLVLGGALGNLNDRITRAQVVDFIDFRADWVMRANAFVAEYYQGWTRTDHWPTFNVADVAIVIGVGLMAVDMFTHRPRSIGRGAPHSLGREPGAALASYPEVASPEQPGPATHDPPAIPASGAPPAA
jgi:signal peptidase II